MNTTKESVEKLLRPRRWVSTYEVEALGGQSALRRLRELRQQGFEIKKRKGDGNQYEYRLVARP